MAEAKKTAKKVAKTSEAETKTKVKASRKASESNETQAKAEDLAPAKESEVKKVAKKAKEPAQNEQAIKPNAEEAQPVESVANAEKEGETAKAGKRSAKALKEADEKVKKEERKAKAGTKEAEAEEHAAAKPVIKVRSKLERRGKKFQESAKLIDATKDYPIKEALELAVKSSPVKFDATVELHIRLNVDPKQSDQNIRSSLVLPNGTGKTVKVAVFAEADKIDAAKKAGADIAGADEFLQQLEKGVVDFDILIAAPSVMAKLGKYARLLGPKGLMPNPKSGTVTADIVKAVKEAKAGRVEYRVDSNGIIHTGIGKVSFGADKLLANAEAILNNVKQAKPATVKGTYIVSVYTTTSMGPSVKVSGY